jgi:hypothetical protein
MAMKSFIIVEIRVVLEVRRLVVVLKMREGVLEVEVFVLCCKNVETSCEMRIWWLGSSTQMLWLSLCGWLSGRFIEKPTVYR